MSERPRVPRSTVRGRLAPAPGDCASCQSVELDRFDARRRVLVCCVCVQTPTREVVTPSIDELARTGLELDRMYTYKFCSPSRRFYMLK